MEDLVEYVERDDSVYTFHIQVPLKPFAICCNPDYHS